MEAFIIERPLTFDRVDRVKEVVGQVVGDGDDRLWILGQAMVVSVDGRQHVVPAGFTTDGASIPRIAQFLTGWEPWEDPQRWAAIVHDFLYCAPGVVKAYGDRAFRMLLDTEGAKLYQREIMYWSVVWFGHSAYEKDQAKGPQIWI